MRAPGGMVWGGRLLLEHPLYAYGPLESEIGGANSLFSASYSKFEVSSHFSIAVKGFGQRVPPFPATKGFWRFCWLPGGRVLYNQGNR